MRLIISILMTILSSTALGQSVSDILTGNWSGVFDYANNWSVDDRDINMEIEKKSETEFNVELIIDVPQIGYKKLRKVKQKYIGRYDQEKKSFILNEKPSLLNKALGSSCNLEFNLIIKGGETEIPQLIGENVITKECYTAITLRLIKKVTEMEKLVYADRLKKKDSLELAIKDSRKITYFDCNLSLAKEKDFPESNFDCSDYTFSQIASEERKAALNYAFGRAKNIFSNQAASYYSLDRAISDKSICLEKNNFFDPYFLGTWSSANGNFIYIFTCTGGHKVSPFKVTAYYYNYTSKSYSIITTDNELFATNIDSMQIMENHQETNSGNGFIPVEYSIVKYSRLSLRPISYNYRIPVSRFFSKFDYRNLLKSKKVNNDFFCKSIQLNRVTAGLLKDDSLLTKEKKSALNQLFKEFYDFVIVKNESKTLLTSNDSFISNRNGLLGFDKFFNPIFKDSETKIEIEYDDSGLQLINK